MSILYSRIRELANQKHISLAELERTLSFSNGIISTWKNGKPSIDKVEKVADYFGVSTDYLLGRDKDDEADSETPEYRAIQRNAKQLDPSDQKKLLEIMKAAFGDTYGDENN